jgi:Ca2+-binding RTX toxin-like protein
VLVGGIGRDAITSYGGRDDLDGGSSADLLTVVHVSPGTTSLGGGPGADVLTVGALLASTCVVAEGGAGSDELVPTVSGQVRKGKVDADLRAGAFGVRGSGGDGCGSVGSIESLTIDNPFGDAQRLRWFVLGTGVGESVVLRHGGSVLATMGAGRDQVVGSSGNDNLKGGPGRDKLFGGGGKDVAIGGPGKDTCRKVEFKRGCEIPA